MNIQTKEGMAVIMRVIAKENIITGGNAKCLGRQNDKANLAVQNMDVIEKGTAKEIDIIEVEIVNETTTGHVEDPEAVPDGNENRKIEKLENAIDRIVTMKGTVIGIGLWKWI